MIDNRIVLPLDAVRRTAAATHHFLCWGDVHDNACLLPYVEERDRLMAEQATPEVTPDCRDGKCAACVGCPHDCHREAS